MREEKGEQGLREVGSARLSAFPMNVEARSLGCLLSPSSPPWPRPLILVPRGLPSFQADLLDFYLPVLPESPCPPLPDGSLKIVPSSK